MSLKPMREIILILNINLFILEYGELQAALQRLQQTLSSGGAAALGGRVAAAARRLRGAPLASALALHAAAARRQRPLPAPLDRHAANAAKNVSYKL